LLFEHYSDIRYRKMRFYAKSNRERSEAKMMQSFQFKMGGPEDVIICFGDWSAKTQMKYKQATVLGKGMRDMFRKAKYEIYLVKEFRTSKGCFNCGDTKEGHCKRILKVKNRRDECDCEECIRIRQSKQVKMLKKRKKAYEKKRTRTQIKRRSKRKKKHERKRQREEHEKKDKSMNVAVEDYESLSKTKNNNESESNPVKACQERQVFCNGVLLCNQCKTYYNRNALAALNQFRVSKMAIDTCGKERPKYLSHKKKDNEVCVSNFAGQNNNRATNKKRKRQTSDESPKESHEAKRNRKLKRSKNNVVITIVSKEGNSKFISACV